MLYNINEWRLIRESLGSKNLGLSNRHKIGGVIGSKFGNDEVEDDNLEDDNYEDEFGDDEFDSEEDEEGFDSDEDTDDSEFNSEEEGGEENGFSDKHPGKKFPPETSDKMLGKSVDNDDNSLDNIDPNLLGDEFGGDEDNQDAVPPEESQEMPCPECNPEGENQEGDPQCQSCQGLGFVMEDPSMTEENPDEDMMNSEQPFEKTPHFESNDFIKSLTNQAKGNYNKKNSSGFSEDFLITPQEKDPKPGEVGFAPQGSLNSVGSGYTMDDLKDIPVIESRKYPTLKQYKKSKKRSR